VGGEDSRDCEDVGYHVGRFGGTDGVSVRSEFVVGEEMGEGVDVGDRVGGGTTTEASPDIGIDLGGGEGEEEDVGPNIVENVGVKDNVTDSACIVGDVEDKIGTDVGGNDISAGTSN